MSNGYALFLRDVTLSDLALEVPREEDRIVFFGSGVYLLWHDGDGVAWVQDQSGDSYEVPEDLYMLIEGGHVQRNHG